MLSSCTIAFNSFSSLCKRLTSTSSFIFSRSPQSSTALTSRPMVWILANYIILTWLLRQTLLCVLPAAPPPQSSVSLEVVTEIGAAQPLKAACVTFTKVLMDHRPSNSSFFLYFGHCLGDAELRQSAQSLLHIS